ncbi:MAG: hypothetical protein ABEI11_01190, partial [Haloarculaceae archaeon]
MGSRDRARPPDGSGTVPPAPVPAPVYDLVADEERRAAVVAVAEADGPVSVAALATMLAARERGRPPGRLRAS